LARRQAGKRSGVTVGLIYTRVSSDEQASERLSLPAQLQVCRSYAADKNWIIGGEHMDVLSGSRDDRASYQALLTEARLLAGQGRNVAVVVMRLDRFGRRVLERVRDREELKALGVGGARIYGDEDLGGTGGIGGLNAFFILTDEPEVYNLPARPKLPQDETLPGLLSTLGAALLLGAGLIFSFRKR